MVDPLKARISIREIRGHRDVVSSITVAENEGYAVTSGNDYQVRLWSRGLDLWGYINQITEKVDPLWFFP